MYLSLFFVVFAGVLSSRLVEWFIAALVGWLRTKYLQKKIINKIIDDAQGQR